MIAALPSPTQAAAARAAPASRSETIVYGFAGADLGDAVNLWRATAPGRAAACAPASPAAEILVCHGGDIPLGGGFMARDPTYTFTNGRLSKITFRSSIDGFGFAMASLKHRFGPPTVIARDRIVVADGLNRAHVGITWRNGRSTITLNDPTADAAHLEVDMRLDAAYRDRPRRD
jgi:hypothetical protein